MPYDLVQAVHEYVRQHLGETVAVRSIAEHVGLHPSYLNTCFHAQTGVNVKTYIHQIKTQEAKRLLRETSYSISQIGTMLGYFDQSHFTRVFKRFAGKTPAQYRMQ